ncbi:MAG TPA: THUMP domain-containing class I SAM-dependent methyltransferase [Trueperaceae bacterium]|nr:THUMP domain-containing class I SAM-dependent methyltransferase [Trueperaceae bacterium]
MASARFVADVVTGLEDLAAEELRRLGAAPVAPGRGEVRFDHGQVGAVLRRSRLASAVYRALFFDVPRPKALLGDAAHRRLAAAAREVAAAGGMRSFRLAAAGADSAVFLRLADSLTAATGLVHDPDEGELLARFRRAGAGWEVLLRLTPRPLSTRAWRVCNLPGGANATVAAAMADLAGPGGSYLNLMCGSGTLLVERALAGPGGPYVGVDVSAEAVACARRNLAAAGLSDAEVVVDDVARPGFRVPGDFDVVAADAPWGDAVGDHAANEALYRALFAAARRHLAPGGRFALLSHEVRLVERILREGGWRAAVTRRVEHGGHRPLLLVLHSEGGAALS